MMLAAEIKKIKTVVFVTGKFYYDLLEKKEQLKREDVALIRVEQLFPLPGQRYYNPLLKNIKTQMI